MSLPTPNYVLMEAVAVTKDAFDEKILNPGEFVRPINSRYLPQHIKDTMAFKWHDPERDVFCYTKLGIVLIPIDKMRRV